MKVLVIGPSGSGKTYLSNKFREMGLNSADMDDLETLCGWYDGKGKRVKFPKNAGKKFFDNHSFLWDRKRLQEYINSQRNSDIYLFGSSGNMFEVLDLFDKVYYLKADPELIKKRLAHSARKNPFGKTKEQREVAARWVSLDEKRAEELGVEFIDAKLSPEEKIKLIRR